MLQRHTLPRSVLALLRHNARCLSKPEAPTSGLDQGRVRRAFGGITDSVRQQDMRHSRVKLGKVNTWLIHVSLMRARYLLSSNPSSHRRQRFYQERPHAARHVCPAYCIACDLMFEGIAFPSLVSNDNCDLLPDPGCDR